MPFQRTPVLSVVSFSRSSIYPYTQCNWFINVFAFIISFFYVFFIRIPISSLVKATHYLHPQSFLTTLTLNDPTI